MNLPGIVILPGFFVWVFCVCGELFIRRCFCGWYTGQGCTVLYDFNAPVTSDLTLYAGWNAVSPAVPASETPAGKSPAPLAGVIAGLGAALAVFGLRMRWK